MSVPAYLDAVKRCCDDCTPVIDNRAMELHASFTVYCESCDTTLIEVQIREVSGT